MPIGGSVFGMSGEGLKDPSEGGQGGKKLETIFTNKLAYAVLVGDARWHIGRVPG